MNIISKIFKRDTPEDFITDGTDASLWPDVQAWWQENTTGFGPWITPRMADRVWVANRCIQLNAQQVASIPLKFHGTYQPIWLASPDPVWYPNGIGDAIFAIVKSLYGWGYAIIIITSRYASGLPATWTVVDPECVYIYIENGRRAYKIHDKEIDPFDVVQIDRNPGWGLKGTSAIQAYASQAWGLVAAGELGRSVMNGGVPTSVLKSQRKLTKAQAQALQAQWVDAVTRRNGAPPVLPPDLDFSTLSFSPKDLLLLEAQEFTARVIASAYGVPAVLLNLPLAGSLTYQNPAMLGEQWWRFELLPTAERIANAFSAQMLPANNWVEFDPSSLFATLVPQQGNTNPNDPQATPEPVIPNVAPSSPSQQVGAPTLRPIRPGVM